MVTLRPFFSVRICINVYARDNRNGYDYELSNRNAQRKGCGCLCRVFETKDGNKHLVLIDAGRAAFGHMLDIDQEKMKDVFLLKVPHHGSKYNLDSTMINWIKPTIAIVSAQSEELYFSALVKNALKRRGTAVFSTIGGGFWYNRGFNDREDYEITNPD